jgi:ribose 5-phosphate isomerase A
MDLERLKEEAALGALSEVREGMTLGLGTGSTVYWFLKHLGEHLSSGRLSRIKGVPTSERTTSLCREFKIPLVALEDAGTLDLAVDGTDEVDPRLQLIKGLGGALLREKMVASAARRVIIIADETKRVSKLGSRSPLPVEVVAFAWRSHIPALKLLGCEPELRTTCSEPLFTDNGNVILDCHFPGGIDDPVSLNQALNGRPGVVGHGLFLDLCHRAILATSGGLVDLLLP